MPQQKHIQVTIADGESASPVFYLDDVMAMWVFVPQTFTGSLALQGLKADGVTWEYLRYTGLEGQTAHAVAQIPAPAGGWTPAEEGWFLFPVDAYPAMSVRLVAQTGETPDAQSGDQVLDIVAKGTL